MTDNSNEIIDEVFCDIMESLAFMFGEMVDKTEVEAPAANLVKAVMTFSGPNSGSIAIAVPETVCPEIAANVLGLDAEEDIDPADALDALKEVLNVICGHVLTRMAGTEPVFDLSIPEVTTITAESWQELINDSAVVAFDVDETPMLLGLWTEDWT